MFVQYLLTLGIIFVLSCEPLCALSLAEKFKQFGYVEIFDEKHKTETFDSLYAAFDQLTNFLHSNPTWTRKLYHAKERFIRSKDRDIYSTDFFGFYDESEREGRKQISFYYSIHFHEFLYTHSPELKQIPEVNDFFEICLEIQKPYGKIFKESATELGLETIFSSEYNSPPILFKVIKYLPSYAPTRPHYDGSVFSLFLDSTNNQSLLLSPYKSSFTIDDFFSPPKERSRNSVLLIPGVFLAEFSIYPTPHIVIESSCSRYATIAFAMRPNFTSQKNELSPLPNFKH